MSEKEYDLNGLHDFLDGLGKSEELASVCRGAAQQALAKAKAAASKHVKTGTYHNSLHVEELPRKGRRVFGVVSDDPKALVLEAEYGILARSLNGVKV